MSCKIISSSAIAVLALSSLLTAGEADLKGAVPGKWTMDIDAASKLAVEKKLPMLIDFSGSDWCGWCKLMDKNVFAEAEWKTYAEKNLVLVLLDFPKDKSIVPKEYVERNDQLKKKYAVKGFPTFILLDTDAETEIARLVAGKDKTPASFIKEITMASRYLTSEVERYTKTLSAENKAAYLKLIGGITANSNTIEEKKKLIGEAYESIAKAENETDELKSAAAEFRAARMGDDKLKEYKALKSDMDKAEKALKEWLESEPEQNQANAKIFQTMSGEIKDIAAQLAEF